MPRAEPRVVAARPGRALQPAPAASKPSAHPPDGRQTPTSPAVSALSSSRAARPGRHESHPAETGGLCQRKGVPGEQRHRRAAGHRRALSGGEAKGPPRRRSLRQTVGFAEDPIPASAGPGRGDLRGPPCVHNPLRRWCPAPLATALSAVQQPHGGQGLHRNERSRHPLARSGLRRRMNSDPRLNQGRPVLAEMSVWPIGFRECSTGASSYCASRSFVARAVLSPGL